MPIRSYMNGNHGRAAAGRLAAIPAASVLPSFESLLIGGLLLIGP
jgi:hypothetical protein